MAVAELLWVGIVTGSIYALGALGLSLFWGVINFLNVAYGEFISMSGLIMVMGAVLGLPFVVAAATGILLATIAFVLLDRVLFQFFRDRGPFTLLIVSVGAMFILRNAMNIIWGPDPRFVGVRIGESFRILGAVILPKHIITVATSVAIMTVVYIILKRTRIGLAMRASAEDTDLARVRGIKTERIILYVTVMTGMMAAIAGIFVGVNFQTAPYVGFRFLIPLVAAVVLGGIGDPRGAVLGGLIIGVAQEMSVAVIPPAYKIAVGMVIFMIVLLVRPEGIFGGVIEE